MDSFIDPTFSAEGNEIVADIDIYSHLNCEPIIHEGDHAKGESVEKRKQPVIIRNTYVEGDGVEKGEELSVSFNEPNSHCSNEVVPESNLELSGHLNSSLDKAYLTVLSRKTEWKMVENVNESSSDHSPTEECHLVTKGPSDRWTQKKKHKKYKKVASGILGREREDRSVMIQALVDLEEYLRDLKFYEIDNMILRAKRGKEKLHSIMHDVIDLVGGLS
ncbi:lipoxygenase [Corchorus olitorius]|uniref:Lipoxygenase n=1 Tax=Corchorus olitorius TaxID=93759 RepID=A0A1R3HD28_9ROSI|nr:lipoxygenase [Corchorus olitorius]